MTSAKGNAAPLDPPGMSARLALWDSDTKTARGDLALGIATLSIQWALWTLTGLLLALAILPAGAAMELLGRGGAETAADRLSLAGGAFALGYVARSLHRRSVNTLKWARLPDEGSLFVGRHGIVLRHPAVLDGDVPLPWSAVRAIAMDSGAKHDAGSEWRRFPCGRTSEGRRFLFATDGPPVKRFALIADRPVGPNVAIVLQEPLTLRNPHAELVDVAFASNTGRGTPARPPAAHGQVMGVLLAVRDLPLARRVLIPSGLVRSLRPDDLEPKERRHVPAETRRRNNQPPRAGVRSSN